MTGDHLAVAPRPAVLERTPSAPARPRPNAMALAAGRSAMEPRSTDGPARPGTEEPSAARLRALLADPAVRVRAHRDDASARLVLQVLDRATGEVIEQYPPDQLLRFYAALRESLGALVDERA
jgi:FlaG protein